MSALSSLPFISALPPLLDSSITATSFFSSVAWWAVSLATPLRTRRSSGRWCSPVSAFVPSCFPHASPSSGGGEPQPSVLGLSGNCSDFSFSIILKSSSRKKIQTLIISGIQKGNCNSQPIQRLFSFSSEVTCESTHLYAHWLSASVITRVLAARVTGNTDSTVMQLYDSTCHVCVSHNCCIHAKACAIHSMRIDEQVCLNAQIFF